MLQGHVVGPCCHGKLEGHVVGTCCHGELEGHVVGPCCHGKLEGHVVGPCCHGKLEAHVVGTCCLNIMQGHTRGCFVVTSLCHNMSLVPLLSRATCWGAKFCSRDRNFKFNYDGDCHIKDIDPLKTPFPTLGLSWPQRKAVRSKLLLTQLQFVCITGCVDTAKASSSKHEGRGGSQIRENSRFIRNRFVALKVNKRPGKKKRRKRRRRNNHFVLKSRNPRPRHIRVTKQNFLQPVPGSTPRQQRSRGVKSDAKKARGLGREREDAVFSHHRHFSRSRAFVLFSRRPNYLRAWHSLFFLVVQFIMLLFLSPESVWTKSCGLTNQAKATEYFLRAVLFLVSYTRGGFNF